MGREWDIMFIMFTKHKLKEALSGVTRYAGDVNKVFAAVSCLIHGEYESSKIRNCLRLLVPPAHENISIIVNKIRSCYMALYSITHANMDTDRQIVRVEQHCIDGLVTVIMPQCKDVYERYRKTQVDNGETFSLLEIIDFISTCELSNAACAWTSAKNLPREISMLDYNSLQLDVKTDLAINYAQVNSTVKPDEYRKQAKDKTEKRGREHQKSDRSQGGKKNTSWDRKSPKDSGKLRKYDKSRSSSGQSTSRSQSRGSGREQRSGDRNKERRKGGYTNRNSKSPAKGGGFADDITCLRCGSKNHSAASCPRYTTFCRERCEDCTLYHPTAKCNQRRRDYKSPQRSRNSRNVDKVTRRVNNLAVEEETNVSVQPENVTSVPLGTNIFRKN